MPNSNTQLSKNRIQAFSDLYHKKLLGDYETTSGNGSTLVNSSRMRRGLSEFISWGVGSVLDVGCGDFNWQRALQLNGCQILAVDVVPELIEKNKKIYTQPNIRFDVMDIVTTIPPAHDLVICRDLFTHFPSSDIVAAVNNIKQSGSRFLAATGYYPGNGHQKMMENYLASMNKDSAAGYWRAIQLRKLPYSFPEPLFTIFESAPERALDIWYIDDLPLLTPEYLSLVDANPLEHADFMEFSFYRALCALPYVEKIGLFGSRASYTNRLDSDADFVVLCAQKTSRQQRFEIHEIFRTANLPLKLDCIIYSPNEFSKIFLQLNTRILYDRSRSS